MDEWNSILHDDDPITPSTAFVSRVMEALRTESETPPPIPLPWGRLVVAPLLCLTLIAIAGTQAVGDARWPVLDSEGIVSECARWSTGAVRPLAPLLLPLQAAFGSLLIAGLLWPLAFPLRRSRQSA